MQMSETINELAAALALAQPKFEIAKKTHKNPHLNNQYAALVDVWEAIKPALAENGLAVMQLAGPTLENTVSVTTLLTHKSGQYVAETITMPLPPPNLKLQLAQVYGGIITYARRYALSALLGICSEEDDDGNGGSKPPQRASPQEARTASTVAAPGQPLALTVNTSGAQCAACHCPSGAKHTKDCKAKAPASEETTA